MPLLTDQERLGTTLAEKYRIDRIVGRGGMGVVFAATHLWTGRPVAVKLLLPGLADDAGLVKRFLREARAAAGLRHPNVVDVLDMGSEPDGTVYLVLEMLVGESLDAVLERHGRLTLRELAAWVVPVCDAVGAAHGQGIVHRDLKPENIFLHRPAEGVTLPKLLDFGIAKVLGTGTSKQTAVGSVIGTLHYMSPEQAEGRADVGPRSDVWALGVVLYECLTGRMPFDGSNGPAILLAISRGAFEPVSSLRPEMAPALCAVVTRCLSHAPDGRFADAAALADALREALQRADVETPTRIEPPRTAPSAEAPRPANTASPEETHPGFAPTLEATAVDPPPGRRAVWPAAVVVGALVAVAVAVSLRPSVDAPPLAASPSLSVPAHVAATAAPAPAAAPVVVAPPPAPVVAAPPPAPVVAAPPQALAPAPASALEGPSGPVPVARHGGGRRAASRPAAGPEAAVSRPAAAEPTAPAAPHVPSPPPPTPPATNTGLAREW
jgi:serine/threonine protein kinase